ncbi:hypothetical protein [Pseudorhodobacter ferrugineus]|uniref:hypothetical protein n=1 Tax=Pseudorhodobacter ferrugineus TaxID=77008 RepID=UPI00040B68AA|nr:hypothetical protein [Pseudorhodobacter ferrugineus]
MDTNHFVLMAAAFIILATVMVSFSQWRYIPTPQAVAHFACRFNGFCRGTDCATAVPPNVFVVPQRGDAPAYLTDDLTLGSQIRLDTVAAREWVGRRGEQGMVRLRIADSGAMTWVETAGFTADSAVNATATGQCRDLTTTIPEQG